MAFGIGKAMLAPLLFLNFCLYFISACLAGIPLFYPDKRCTKPQPWNREIRLAGSILNRNLDANRVGVTNQIGNVAMVFFIPFALIASVVGIASTLAGIHHLRIWGTESLSAAAATSVIAWFLTLLAMGLAAKEIKTGYGRSKRLKTLEVFMIILSFFELLYLLATHGGSVTREGYANTLGHKAAKNSSVV